VRAAQPLIVTCLTRKALALFWYNGQSAPCLPRGSLTKHCVLLPTNFTGWPIDTGRCLSMNGGMQASNGIRCSACALYVIVMHLAAGMPCACMQG
jgi:hypothetical protein